MPLRAATAYSLAYNYTHYIKQQIILHNTYKQFVTYPNIKINVYFLAFLLENIYMCKFFCFCVCVHVHVCVRVCLCVFVHTI